MRQLVTPLLRALAFSASILPGFVDTFRYPLAGEIALKSLAHRVRIPTTGRWVGMLAGRHNTAPAICQSGVR